MFIALGSKNQPLANESSSEDDGTGQCTHLERAAASQMARRSRRGIVKVPGKAVKVGHASLPANLENWDDGEPVLRSTSLPCSLNFADNLRTRPRALTSSEQQEHPSFISPPSRISGEPPMTLVNVEKAAGCSPLDKGDAEEEEGITPTPSPVSFHSVPEEDSGHESPSERETLAPSLQQVQVAPVVSSQSWLMRLFQSKLFDMSIAIHYLFNSKEPGVQNYLGSKLFVSCLSPSVCVCPCVYVVYTLRQACTYMVCGTVGIIAFAMASQSFLSPLSPSLIMRSTSTCQS